MVNETLLDVARELGWVSGFMAGFSAGVGLVVLGLAGGLLSWWLWYRVTIWRSLRRRR